MKENICVVGLGYIGLPTAVILASKGYHVVGVDVSRKILDQLEQGECPIKEDGMEALVKQTMADGFFIPKDKPEPSDVFIICVPTPLTRGAGRKPRSDMSFVKKAAEAIRDQLVPGNLVILESTVPPGTIAQFLADCLRRGDLEPLTDLDLAHCPERVIPGNLLYELVNNDRIVGGHTLKAAKRAQDLYQSFALGEVIITDATTAELCKLMENTYRDVQIALANQFAKVAEGIGVDVWHATELANRHPRVNIINPGPGVGGHCIPIDPWFIVDSTDVDTGLIQEARRMNDSMPSHACNMIMMQLEKLDSPKVILLGAAYKGNVNDARESPTEAVASILTENGCKIHVVDPMVEQFSLPLSNLEDVIDGADALMLLVDHDDFLKLQPELLVDRMRNPFLLDTRGFLNMASWKSSGFKVRKLGDGRWDPRDSKGSWEMSQ